MLPAQKLERWADDADLADVPAARGVFLISFGEGEPYLGRTADLRKRLVRLLGVHEGCSRRLNLRDIASSVHFQRTGSKFESDWILYELARAHRPLDYQRFLKLRRPPFVKVHLNNRFPRTYVTTKLTKTRALFYGPFRSRVAAERFEDAFLDLFGIRRCEENLEPSPEHPGCIYGEMNLCIRPCQAACSDEEYGHEVGRVLQFLNSGGESLVREIEQARDGASERMEFEKAAKLHDRLAKVKDALRLSGEPARDLDEFHGVVIQRAARESVVKLTLLYRGALQPALALDTYSDPGQPVSLDAKVRELIEAAPTVDVPPVNKSEHLAILRRWYFSSFRKGEFIPIDSMDRLPIRKLVNAISRVATGRER